MELLHDDGTGWTFLVSLGRPGQPRGQNSSLTRGLPGCLAAGRKKEGEGRRTGVTAPAGTGRSYVMILAMA